MFRSRGDRFPFVAVYLVVLAQLLSLCAASDIVRRNASIPPISVTPDQNWDGIDGQWSTFTLRVGTPAQFVRVYLSTASQQTWVVLADACSNSTTGQVDTSCEDNRGYVFNVSQSTTWEQQGFYMLWTEGNLGYTGNGQFGYDTVGLGGLGDEGPTLLNTTVGGFITTDFYLGHFGINPKPTNFTTYGDPSPSYMTYLFEQGLTPSMSFGYTAGAQYRFTSVLSSLTIGGYDTSRYVPNNVSFTFANDNERDIVVMLLDARMSDQTKPDIDLLPNPVAMYIDSTIPEIWLPLEACQAFEKAFGLTFDNDTELYLVDDVLHKQLLAENANVTFTLGQNVGANETVDIVVPYQSFNLQARPPYRGLQNTSYYFPLRRAANESQYVFGRTFLQEAYIVVDWERQNFSVYQCSWVFGAKPNIVPIISPTFEDTPNSGGLHHHFRHRLSSGAVVGIAVGSGFSVAMLVFGIVFFIWRKRHMAKAKAKYEAEAAAAAKAKEQPPDRPLPQNEETPISPVSQSAQEEGGSNVFPKAELPAEPLARGEGQNGDSPESKPEGARMMSSPTSPYSPGIPSPALPSPTFEVENNERQVFEMMGDVPQRLEADGRQLSEKESMMVRERLYNGVDPQSLPTIIPPPVNVPKRPAPILPADIAVVNRRGLWTDNMPISPATPRAPRDGRFLEAEDTIMSPVSPLDSSTEGSTSRRRFSYE